MDPTSSHEDEEPEDEERSEPEYCVEAIRAWRYNMDKGQREFFIKWENYSEEENTWEPEEYLNCEEILNKFIQGLSGDQAKYFHTPDLRKLTGFQRNAEFEACLGADGPHESDDEDSDKVKKHKFYILAKFKDCKNLIEEITFDEYLQHRPEDALKFCEERLLYR